MQEIEIYSNEGRVATTMFTVDVESLLKGVRANKPNR
jgi:hypothetical protein